MRMIAPLILVLLAGCVDPSLSTSVTVGSDGVSVSNAVSGQVGGATVTVSN